MFLPATKQPNLTNESVYFLLFRDNKLALDENGAIPVLPANSAIKNSFKRLIYLGTLNGQHAFTGEAIENVELENGWDFFEFKPLFGTIDDELYSLLGHASQITTWDKNHQFCPVCGTKTAPHNFEKCKVCPNCKFRNYPTISPSIIVSITRGNEIMLQRSPHFPEGLYSVVAGFVEAGETLEECVVREVREETGLKIKNIKYHSSQPWAYPHSLMVGFTAEYESGYLSPCQFEIEDAGWYTVDEMPTTPGPSAIAHHLINEFVKSQK